MQTRITTYLHPWLKRRTTLRSLTLRLFIWTAAISLLVVAGSPLVHAADEDIRVVSETQEINFPSDVRFDITVESTSEITEVRLLFRSSASRIWAYAYPSFEPGNRITANHRLATSGSNYVPPGAELEYQYVISDAAGNTLKTEPATFEYMDNRFEWDRTQVGPLTLVHHDIRQSKVDDIVGRITDDIQHLTSLLEVQNGQQIKGMIYNRRSETEDAFPFQSQTISDAGVFQGFAFSNHRIFVGVGLDPRLIVHETTHLLLDESLGSRALGMPAWLNEGFASYSEPDSSYYSGRRVRDVGVPLRSMNSVSGTPSHIGDFYLKSASVVGFLVQYRGEATFQGLLAELRRGRTVDQALMAVYGFDIDGLETRWVRDAAESGGDSSTRQQRPQPGHVPSSERPSLFLFFDAWVFGGLALLVLAVAAGRLVFGNLLPKSDFDDEADDWPEPDDPPSGGPYQP